MNSRTDAVIREIEKVIVGKREVVERVLMAVLSEGHILLDDVPGVGKTTLALACSRVMGKMCIRDRRRGVGRTSGCRRGPAF